MFVSNAHAQLIKISKDTSYTNSKMSITSFTFARKFENKLIAQKKRFYDFGTSLNLLEIKCNNNIFVGASPFFDIHVIDDKGYEKIGFRIYSDFRFTSSSSIIISSGPVINTYHHPGQTFSEVSNGWSNEFIYYPVFDMGLAFRWDVIFEKNLLNVSRTSDIAIGLKIRTQGIKSVLGYAFGAGSFAFNSVLRSQ